MEANTLKKINDWLSGNYDQSVKDEITALQKNNPGELEVICIFRVSHISFMEEIICCSSLSNLLLPKSKMQILFNCAGGVVFCFSW